MNLKIEKAGEGYSYTIGAGQSRITGWCTSREYIERAYAKFSDRREALADWRKLRVLMDYDNASI